MKCLVVYTSRSGNTEKLARAIAAALGPECVLAAAADAPPPENFDFIALGFGVYGGWPDGDLRSYMKRCRRKNVGLFMTLGAWPDSEHAFLCMGRAEGLLENCTTRVKFICQGGYTPEHLARMKSRPADSPHAWDAGREARVAEAMKHPDETDLCIGADRFRAAAEKLRNAPPRPAKPPKRAQVLAVFGSTVPGAEASYRAIEDAMRERHPELPLFRACTSYAVRSKCAAAAPSLPGVLMRLVREGYAAANLVVGFLSAGEEYHKVRSEAAAFGPQLELCVTRPPLLDRAGLRRFLGAVLAGLPERAPDECVLFMGHGHAGGRSDFQYMAAASELAGLDPALHLACVEGEPSFEPVLPELRGKRVRLVPFMLVAGDHALSDMAGDGPESWKRRLEAAGYETECVLHGLGENPAVARYFAELV